jgi:hypothetical protein
MKRGSSPEGDFCLILPKNGARFSPNGEKGNDGRPLSCEVIDKRRCRSEKLLMELTRCPWL